MNAGKLFEGTSALVLEMLRIILGWALAYIAVCPINFIRANKIKCTAYARDVKTTLNYSRKTSCVIFHFNIYKIRVCAYDINAHMFVFC